MVYFLIAALCGFFSFDIGAMNQPRPSSPTCIYQLDLWMASNAQIAPPRIYRTPRILTQRPSLQSPALINLVAMDQIENESSHDLHILATTNWDLVPTHDLADGMAVVERIVQRSRFMPLSSAHAEIVDRSRQIITRRMQSDR